MKQGLPENLPMGLVDEDHTTTTRNLARNLDAFQMSNITQEYANVTDARKAVQKGDIYGFTSFRMAQLSKPSCSVYLRCRSIPIIRILWQAHCFIVTCA